MERLTAFDAGFLDAEDADRHVSLAVGAVSVLEGPVPDQHELVAAISERILRVPRLRQVVRRQPLDLSAPEWVDDPALDLAHHIRRAALPHPGDDEALFRFTAEAMETRLDRERPLWQCWIIEGLAEDRWAMLMKVHHCIADGIATMHLLAGLSDGGEGETYAGAIRAAHERPQNGFSLPALTLNPLRWAHIAWNTASALTATAAMTIGGAVEIVDSLVRPGSSSSLNGPVTTMRRYSAVQVPLARVASVCQAFDVTLNDVALAAITDSYRAALKRRGEEPRHNSLRTLVPVSVRSDDAAGRFDNRVSVMLPYLPVDEPDRVEQLQAVHRRLRRAKGGGQRQAGSAVVAAVKLVPFALATRAIRLLTSLPQRGVVALATNVPGPQHRLQVMGREVLRMLPVPPMALRLRTAVAILSYGDDLVFGITTDFDAFPDVDELAAGIAEAVTCLSAAAHHPRPTREPRG
ncbi:wax ester/triacylglycerol synthase family O-acyltransferase [Mycolicibacterium austroafricanum]|uniref:Diacylglycerol O-acyltransferase n=1 Tax=Mycolicibacterium austroafricanum TaxID=39687 RepID=A0ABT8H884_MYCAO|nr:wax ester/triacylglycerol synthase family O-acyltransferase [Mycolicibacterium austroafricanum]MDN4516972.1 wax ester/triacylglycerol synthase family O-acyltransferase [Mycolicibacterium austroafricanum]QRZ08069.1 wax ester/triacylglycerol synthase family O-acyltransferase [Mycolicibacterium austroafricanum]QZT69732.1 wax ester/triacylglycerol synthase family O-acyltransferase [Mycolicibacterium austroafricanum]